MGLCERTGHRLLPGDDVNLVPSGGEGVWRRSSDLVSRMPSHVRNFDAEGGTAGACGVAIPWTRERADHVGLLRACHARSGRERGGCARCDVLLSEW
jgi:hypothetical protein